MPYIWRDEIEQAECTFLAVKPSRVIKIKDQDQYIKNVKPEQILSKPQPNLSTTQDNLGFESGLIQL